MSIKAPSPQRAQLAVAMTATELHSKRLTRSAPQDVADGGSRDDRRAFEHELVALIPQLRAYARSLCKDAANADDLAQEVLAKALKRREQYLMGSNMLAWTFTILRNQFLQDKRRDWRSQPLDLELAERTLAVVDNPDAILALDEVRRALAVLPPAQSEALIMVGAGGFTYDQTAEAMGLAAGTVKSRVSRARVVLRRVLEGAKLHRDGAPAPRAAATIFSQMRFHPATRSRAPT